MAGNVSDFMKLWTQGDAASERYLQKFLLTGLDKVVQGKSDVLAKIQSGDPAWEALVPPQIVEVIKREGLTLIVKKIQA